MTKNYTKSEEPEKCPFTRLTIISKPEWEDVILDSNYRATYSVLGGKILLSRAFGYATVNGVHKAFSITKKIVAEYMGDTRPYIRIEDFTHLKSASLEGRKCYIDYMKSNPRIRGLIFFGVSPLFQLSVKLAKRLAIVKYETHIVDQYADAVELAARMISDEKPIEIKIKRRSIAKEPVKTTPPSNQTQKYVDELLEYLGNVNWETEGLDKVPSVDPSHPFRPVFDAITLIKGDLDDLYQERKMAMDRVEKELREKDVLLKEIHHRVKNNLQIISSLLSLQSRYIKDARALEMFNESQNRIRSMALLHEKLYQSSDLVRIDFADYIYRTTHNLFSAYGVAPDKIGLELQADGVFLNLDVAVPCGLVINELVSNALKYAFPQSGKNKGRIRICLQKTKGDEIELIIEDNGQGLPKGLDIDTTESLGLRLVKILVNDQLGGSMKVSRKKGTQFKIRFNSTRLK